MPMIDLTLPEGALEPDARAEAVAELTEALLRAEGAPDNEATRAMSWAFVHELPQDAVNVGGAPSERPVYRVMLTVPAGTLLHGPGPFAGQSRRQLVREVTEILLRAEGTGYDDTEAGRVYCIVREVAEGFWGGMGTTFRMEDIAAFAVPELAQTAVSERAREALAAPAKS
jgi:phenylpyruvate tautomerase PptA (4-oxalocrotonate tautomerase family)